MFPRLGARSQSGCRAVSHFRVTASIDDEQPIYSTPWASPREPAVQAARLNKARDLLTKYGPTQCPPC